MRRIMLDMSQTDLADELDLSFQQVQKYEKGTNRMGASRLQQISHILQVPVAFLFDGTPHVADAHTSRNLPPSPDPLIDFMAMGLRTPGFADGPNHALNPMPLFDSTLSG
jgi:transcriptional regulator with XRE-family HTH domain